MLQKLIDKDDPKCLYCKSRCNFQLNSDSSPRSITYVIEIYSCQNCGEVFEIRNWEGDAIENAQFIFSCKEFAVLSVPNNGFHIASRNSLWPSYHKKGECVDIAEFNVDFSDKEKLYQKLKTYIVFS